MKDEPYGREVVISEKVKYVGEGDDPAVHPYMIAYEKACKNYAKYISDRKDVE